MAERLAATGAHATALIRPARRRALRAPRGAADDTDMEITDAASVQLLAHNLDSARSVLDAAQAAPVPASAPPARHADAILQLSAAAQALLSA